MYRYTNQEENEKRLVFYRGSCYTDRKREGCGLANIKQVAARAGLSVACVSKYLKNADSVLPASRSRIEAAIRELQYVPSRTARSLRTKRSYNIQVVVENITNPFFAELFETMRRALEGYGYTAILRPLDKPFSREDFDGADGVAACFLEDEARIGEIGRAAGERPVLCVHWKRLPPERPGVWAEVQEGMALAAAHLMESGCRRIAYVGGPEGNAISAVKRQGAQAVLRHPFAASYTGEFCFQTGYDAAKALASLKERPDGVLCENDVLAAGVICGLHRRGLRVPEDLRVTGFDNIPLAGMYIPAITSVAVPIADMCAEAARQLIGMLDNKPAESRAFSPALVLRQSA